jgi:hypothetical protein
MNSKLRNTLSAIAASGATLAIALMVAVPAVNTPVQDVVAHDLPPAAAGQRVDSVAPLAAAVALSAATAIAAEAHRDTDAHPLKSRKGKQRRQTIVMPYFSFSPRG